MLFATLIFVLHIVRKAKIIIRKVFLSLHFFIEFSCKIASNPSHFLMALFLFGLFVSRVTYGCGRG